MAIGSVNNQNQLQMLAAGACPAPAPQPSVVLVQAPTDDCNTPVCPPATPAPIFLNPDGLFSANQCEITFCLHNTGATAVPVYFGLGADVDAYKYDGRILPSAVDNSTVLSCDDYLADSQGTPSSAPSVNYFNDRTESEGVVAGQIVIQINGGETANVNAQAKQNLRVLQLPIDLSAECHVSRVVPVCTLACGSGDFVAGNIAVTFRGPFAFTRGNGVEYMLQPGVTISARICLTGKYQTQTIVPC